MSAPTPPAAHAGATFPLAALAWLRCPADRGTLHLDAPPAAPTSDRAASGIVRCASCAAGYPLAGGILRLLPGLHALDPESAHEAELRDREAATFDRETRVQQELLNAVEVPAHLRPLRVFPGCAVLELGCGTGRLTFELAGAGAHVLAVDFSLASLELLAAALPPGAPVALVHADLTQLALAPHSFDRALATCTSNLPTRAHRLAMFRLVAEALRPSGRFVFSAYNHTWLHRRRGEAFSGRYHGDANIAWRRFRARELAREVAPFFASAEWISVAPARRLLRRATPRAAARLRPLAFVVHAAARLLGRVPALRGFGWLWVFTVAQPLHEQELPQRPASRDRASSGRSLAAWSLAFLLGFAAADLADPDRARRALAHSSAPRSLDRPDADAASAPAQSPLAALTSGAASTQIAVTTAADATHHAQIASITNSSRYVRYSE
jgi:SAM-dependent methyltransferase